MIRFCQSPSGDIHTGVGEEIRCHYPIALLESFQSIRNGYEGCANDRRLYSR